MYEVKRLSRADENAAAIELGVSVDVVKAVAAVEARKTGFIRGTDLPCILFEGHKFSAFTRGKYDRDFPHLSYPKWTKAHYVGGRGEYDRLLEAIKINDGDPTPALMSTSWGMFQIMGFNHEAAGFPTVRDFVNDQSMGEDRQLLAFVRFIKANNLLGPLRARDWEDFARAYNGPGFRANEYHVKLATEFTRARQRLQQEQQGGTVDLARAEAAALQAALNVELAAGLVVDGWIGKNTINAIRELQRRDGLEETGAINRALFDRLGLDFSAYDETAEV
jgi:hypothetical protein